MKSKKYILTFILSTLIFFSISMNFGIAESPKTQANGEYSLGYEIGDYFEFFCFEMDSTELNNTFGVDWVSNLGSFFWFTSYNAPDSIGQKTRFLVEDITNSSTWWTFQMDGWAWTNKTSNYTAAVVNDAVYGLPFNATGAIFNPSVWLLALPVEDYITDINYPGGYFCNWAAIFLKGSDVEDYQISWIYDDKTGVVKKWCIENSDGETIFEMGVPKSPIVNGFIPGFDTFFVISSVFLMIGISLISIRRKIKN